MENKIVYLDNAATEKPCKSVLENINKLAKDFYNPSSANDYSIKLKNEIEEVRQKISKVINCDPSEIYFTSGASESNSMAINGFKQVNPSYPIVSSSLEHSSILENSNVKYYLGTNTDGSVVIEDVRRYKSCLFCISYANSEVGTINPIKKISDVIHSNDGYLFCDATAAFGKVRIDVKEQNIDMLSASGHKIGSLKGVGFLYINKDIKVSPIIYGKQENGLRGGTYNYMAIRSLGYAIDEIKYNNEIELRNYLINELLKIDNVQLNGRLNDRLPNNVNIFIKDINLNSQQLVGLLELNAFIVSSGTACNAGSTEPSNTLMKMYGDEYRATHSIRITLCKENTKEEIDRLVECLKGIIKFYGGVM